MKKGQIKKTAQWLLTIVFTGYIVFYFSDHRDDLRLVLNLSVVDIALIGGFHIIYFILQAIRLKVVLEACGERKVPCFPWYKAFMLGGFLNKLIPQAGNVYRGICLKRICGLPYTRFAAGFVFFTWIDTWLNFAAAALVIYFTKFPMLIWGIPSALVLAMISTAVFGAPFLLHWGLGSVPDSIKTLKKIRAKGQEIISLVLTAWRLPGLLTKISILGLLIYPPMCVRIYVTFLALGHPLSLPLLALFYALLKVSQLVNITPGNLGIQEVALGYISEQAGVGLAEGILASIILRTMAYLLLMGFGLGFGGWDLLRDRDKYTADGGNRA